jgi:hypothetical protein
MLIVVSKANLLSPLAYIMPVTSHSDFHCASLRWCYQDVMRQMCRFKSYRSVSERASSRNCLPLSAVSNAFPGSQALSLPPHGDLGPLQLPGCAQRKRRQLTLPLSLPGPPFSLPLSWACVQTWELTWLPRGEVKTTSASTV